MPEVLPEPIINHPVRLAGRAPILWVVTAIVAGYTLGAIWPTVSAGMLAGAALPLALPALGLAMKAPLVGFRHWRWRWIWGISFLMAATLLAWAWRDTRVRTPSPEWATLPPREASLTLRVT